MDNNQNNFNIGNQMSNPNNQVPNTNNFAQSLNVIQQGNQVNNNAQYNANQFNGHYVNNIPNNNIAQNPDEQVQIAIQQENKFLNTNIDITNTYLNINREDTPAQSVDYSQDPKVQENIKKRNTVTITSEGRVFIIIILVLLVFIFVLPKIFDFISNIQYK